MADESWKLPSPIPSSGDLTNSCENPLDFTCEDLKGRATGIFLPLDREDVLVKEGDVVDIQEQSLDGGYFVVYNQRSQQTGRVPVDYIEIIPEDIDQVPLPAKIRVDSPPPRAGHGLYRKLGVSRTRGVEVRERMSAAFATHTTSEENGEHPPSGSSTFPRITNRTSTRVATTAHSLAVASVDTSLPNSAAKNRASSFMPTPSPDVHTATEGRRETRSATVDTATCSPTSDVTEYEDGFRLVEQYNIFTASGSDRDGRPVIVFSACRLPAAYKINHDVLLRYMKYTLDQIVEQDYTVLYCHHGFTSHNKPRLAWVKQVYKEMDRKYKKNIKKLYILHPTNFIRVMLSLMKPFINYKFGRKISYINRIAELEPVLFLDQVDIPEEVKRYDRTLRTPVRQVVSTDSRSVFHMPLPRDGDPSHDLAAEVVASKKQFGVPLESVAMDEDHIPRVLSTCVHLLEKKGLEVVGIFRRTPATATIKTWKEQFNQGHKVDLDSHGDPHLAAVLIKLFLRELPEPLLTFALYKPILELKNVPQGERISAVRAMVHRLPPINLAVLQYLITFLTKVAKHEEVNKMSSSNISIVIGPNLVWSSSAVTNLTALTEINSFTLLLINNCSEIFQITQNSAIGST